MILDTLYTQKDARDLLIELRNLKQDLYQHSASSMSDALSSRYSRTLNEEVIKYMKDNSLDFADKNRMQITKMLDTLIDQVTKLPVLELTLAFDPSVRFIKKINSWISSEFSEHVLLNLTTNRDLLGGILLQYKGKYYDYSLKNKLGNIKYEIQL